MVERRKGLRWWEFKARSPSQMAVEGLNSTPLCLNSAPLPIFPETKTPSLVPSWREPVPGCNITTYLPSLRVPCPPLWICQDTRYISQSPWPGPPAPSGTCPGLRPLLEAERIPEAESCWSPDSTLKHILSSLLNP